MTYSTKKKLDRRNMIMAAVKKELKAHNAYVAPEDLKTLAEKLDTSKFYNIEVIRDIESAAKRLQLLQHETKHGYADSNGVEETGEVVIGDIAFGRDHCFAKNEYKECCLTDGDFDMDQPFVVIIKSHHWDYFDFEHPDDSDINKQSVTIVVYTPESIMDEGQYTAKKDVELEAICQLR